MQPLLTHIIVAFNHADYIERAIESAVNQTVPTRLVVVDDASTDGTAEVVRATLARLNSDALFLAADRNRGLTASLNAGLAQVETEFVAYFAGDDWVAPERAAVQTSTMLERGPSCVLSYSDSFRSDAEGRPFDLMFSERHPLAWQEKAGDIYAELLTRPNWLPAPTLMMRTAALRDIGGYDEALSYEDIDICLRLAAIGDVGFVNVPIATHREHEKSLGGVLFRRDNPRWLRDLVNIDRKHLGARAQADAFIADRMRERVVKLYELGESPVWVSERLAETAPWVDSESRSQRTLRALAKFRVPGQAVRRVRLVSKFFVKSVGALRPSRSEAGAVR